ncbi:MAG: hypothetical protein ACI870_000013 [Crocinitomicaceae bacterium]|jgi:hypothetical protein
MTYIRIYKSFQKFIDKDEHFSEDQQQEILKSFEDPRHKKIFRLSVILLVWSTIAITIDSTFIGGGVIASIINGANWRFFIPTAIFSIVNFIIKFIFVKFYLRDSITNTQAAYCGIPYAGSALILGFLLRVDPLFLKGIKHYRAYMLKRGFKYICVKFNIKQKAS